jgi:hypothetical protein
MKSALLICLAFVSCCAVLAQTSQPNAGVASEWDVRKLLESLELQAQHWKPIINEVKPESWLEKGAPQTYVAQWNSAHNQLNYLLASSEALSKEPERLTLALDTLFRMQAMQSTLVSVVEGIRRYQNPALADLMQSAVNENSTNQDKLRQYVQDLAIQKEQEFQVADREAQRCRETLMKQPASREGKTVRK